MSSACPTCETGFGMHVRECSALDPACTHPEDERSPVSGDSWCCGACGLVPVDAPINVVVPDMLEDPL